VTATKDLPVSALAGVGSNRRISGYDAFRGLAVAFMVIDHIALLTPATDLLRMAPGRLAMPMFFLLAGYFATVPRWRHLGIGLVGVTLPFFIPWVDSPNVLVLWALGVVLLWAWRAAELPLWIIAAVALVASANGWSSSDGTYYEPVAMYGLMALGATLTPAAFVWADRLPLSRALASVGRHPIAWYVGHLTAFQLIVLLVEGS
jgi:hypothetical protein